MRSQADLAGFIRSLYPTIHTEKHGFTKNPTALAVGVCQTVFVETGDFAKPFASDNLEESKRLLFVALSRARRNLFLLGGEDQGNAITAPAVRMIQAIQNPESEPEPEPKTHFIQRYYGKKRSAADTSQRCTAIQEASEQLQREFPGDWRLESDLSTVGPTPFILEKIRKVRSKP